MLIRAADLVALKANQEEDPGLLRMDRANVERWRVTSGDQGGPLSLRKG